MTTTASAWWRLPAWSRWRRAEGAWVAWANANLGAMTAEEKLALVEWVFVRTRGTDGAYHAAPFAFPGFDRFAFGLSIADAWARAGHPRGREQPPGSSRSSRPSCAPSTWRSTEPRRPSAGATMSGTATRSTTRPRRAASWTPSSRTRTSTSSRPCSRRSTSCRLRATSSASLFSLTHALDADDAAWRRAFRVIADDRAEAGEAPRWTDEARRQWAGHSARHGTLLYALAQVDRYGDGDKVGWDRFGDTFGAPLDARDFGAYLDEGVRAMSLAHVVWPALSPGWSRAAVLVPRLDAYLDDPAARRYDRQDPEGALGAIARRLCAEGAVADMGQIRAHLQQRIGTHPGEDYASSFADTRECAKHVKPAIAGPQPATPRGPLAPARPSRNRPGELDE